MKYFNNEENIIESLKRIKNEPLKEDSHLYPLYKNKFKTIYDTCKYHLDNQKEEDNYPAIIFLRVILAANRKYNIHVKPNIDRIKKDYNLKTLDDLRLLIRKMDKSQFYDFWGHKNERKYNALINLLVVAEKLKRKYKIDDDYKLMNQWAKDFKIKNLQTDEVGKIKDVALATVQHLRMDFGINTVKPDQRVIEVLEREFYFKKVTQRMAIEMVEEIAEISGLKTRLLDLVFVNYGSGYYDNRNFSSNFMIQLDIAKKLLELGVDYNTVYKATSITKETVLKSNVNKI